jgi:serine/threonine protein kinase
MTVNSENFGNRFQILQELGKGANGEVHLAFDNFLQRQVAIKIIRRKNLLIDSLPVTQRHMG